MVRYLIIAGLVSLGCNLYGQSPTVEEVIMNYNSAQQKLLAVSAARFINVITQNRWDRDSLMLISSNLTGIPFVTAHSEEDESSVDGNDLINAGKILEAIQLSKGLGGEKQISLFIKLAKWYLYKAGTHKADLDSASYYIQEALASSATTGNISRRYECLILLAEYNRQSGNDEEAKKIFLEIVSSSQKDGNRKVTANAWNHLGQLQTDIDSLGLIYLNNSLRLYQQLQLKEKEIEVLWEIAGYHMVSDPALMKNDLIQILALQESLGYKHSLFAEHLLSFMCILHSEHLDALDHAMAAIENMKWSGLSDLEATFCTRVGVAYSALGRGDEAVDWYKKGLEHRNKGTQVFWFKTLLYAATQLVKDGRPEESLSLIEEVIQEFPPITLWEKAQILTTKGFCYLKVGNYKSADENYMAFLQFTHKYPDFDPYGEFTDDYLEIVKFYLARSNVKAARLFVEKAFSKESAYSKAEENYILFKIDSIEGNLKSAINHYIQYKSFDDLDKGIEQRRKFDELTIKYGAEKKDNDIKLLQNEKQLQEARLLQARYTRNWILGGVALLLVIVGLLAYSTRLKQRTNKKLETQQRAIEDQNLTLRHLVDEKDWLVKEIHHRVKNNLQIVMSLLNSQSAYIDNDAALAAIHNSQHRVHAMSLIHQKLYNSEDVSSIDMSFYIRELVSYLSESFNTGQRIRFEVNVEALDADVSLAVPLGLILNEAITNSIKYAFPENSTGLIAISLSKTDHNRWQLSISDNGIGMPPHVNVTKPGSLGMNLIAGLSEDIDGRFSIESNNDGTTIRISFAQSTVVARLDARTAPFVST